MRRWHRDRVEAVGHAPPAITPRIDAHLFRKDDVRRNCDQRGIVQ
jgi:hypothetical protein